MKTYLYIVIGLLIFFFNDQAYADLKPLFVTKTIPSEKQIYERNDMNLSSHKLIQNHYPQIYELERLLKLENFSTFRLATKESFDQLSIEVNLVRSVY